MLRLQLLDEVIQILAEPVFSERGGASSIFAGARLSVQGTGTDRQSAAGAMMAGHLAECARIESGWARTSLEKSAGRRVIVILPWER
jgi:hypothetical protein